jgi:hypothetical protein
MLIYDAIHLSGVHAVLPHAHGRSASPAESNPRLAMAPQLGFCNRLPRRFIGLHNVCLHNVRGLRRPGEPGAFIPFLV